MYHARMFAVVGSSVDRVTPRYKTLANLKRGIARQLRTLRTPGPYQVEEYHNGKRVACYNEG